MKARSGKWLLIAGIIVLLFVLTNPGSSSFKEYVGMDARSHYEVVRRQYNFFLFSIYIDHRGDRKNNYVGLLGNFIETNHEEPPKPDITHIPVPPVRHDTMVDMETLIKRN